MKPDLTSQLSSLDTHILAPIVRLALSNEQVEVVEWSFSRLSGEAVNPSTAGLYRISGTARDLDRIIPWSVILKAVHWIDLSGTPWEKGYMNEPGDWNYWKREALVYTSGILEGSGTNLVPVRCLGVYEPEELAAWIWLEEVHEQGRSIWPIERHVLAARHLGEFNGAYLGYKPPAAAGPWLLRRFLREWSAMPVGWVDLAQDSSFWSQASAVLALPRGTNRRLLRLLEDSRALCDVLEAQLQTLSHQDTHWSNLFATQDADGRQQTTVIDWSFLGFAALGEDLGTQIGGNLAFMSADPCQAAAYYQSAVVAYLDGLKQAGWRGDPTSVRFACAAAAAIRYATWGATMLRWLVQDRKEGRQSWIDRIAQKQNLPVDDTLVRWGTGISFLYDLGDEARLLAAQL